MGVKSESIVYWLTAIVYPHSVKRSGGSGGTNKRLAPVAPRLVEAPILPISRQLINNNSYPVVILSFVTIYIYII